MFPHVSTLRAGGATMRFVGRIAPDPYLSHTRYAEGERVEIIPRAVPSVRFLTETPALSFRRRTR